MMSHIYVCICVFDLCVQDKTASGFQRIYHVTDPFIKRLGLEAELQVTVCVCACRWTDEL